MAIKCFKCEQEKPPYELREFDGENDDGFEIVFYVCVECLPKQPSLNELRSIADLDMRDHHGQ